MSDELLEITAEDADRYFLTQVLTGDTADGYKGVPGIGRKKPKQYLAPTHWGAVEKAIDAGLTKDDAIQQARLARILRWSDWHEEAKAMDTMRHEAWMKARSWYQPPHHKGAGW